jgi:PP-loop superfamily ATP-utilizing enzyme
LLRRILEAAKEKGITVVLKSFGFLYVAFDLEGYVMGSLNRAIGVPG